jgi:preprotein translocase subunit SecA
VASHLTSDHGNGWNADALLADVATIFPLPKELNASAISQMKPREIEEKLTEQAERVYEQREKEIGAENMRMVERLIMLRVIDSLWIEHLTNMEEMRQQAGWATLQQMKAVDAYKIEGYKQFQNLLEAIQHDVVHTIYHVGLVRKEAPKPPPSPMAQVASAARRDTAARPVGKKKVGRNDPCPCGSGKKYKHCCGR